jgi:hypothetical protein
MLKILLSLILAYALLQYVFKVDLNRMAAPYFEPVTELFSDNDFDMEDLSQGLFNGDMSELLDKVNLEQLQDMLDQQDLESLLEDKNLTAEDAQAKIEEMKEMLQEKLEQLQEQ